MNEEILKEAVNFGATIGNHWEKYTDGGRSIFYPNYLHYVGELKSR